jgi:NADH:ubiquinone oxidoreductase subunit K
MTARAPLANPGVQFPPPILFVSAFGVAWFLGVSAVLFGIGLYGVFTRRSPIILLLSVEIMLNAVNLSFVAFCRRTERELSGFKFIISID